MHRQLLTSYSISVTQLVPTHQPISRILLVASQRTTCHCRFLSMTTSTGASPPPPRKRAQDAINEGDPITIPSLSASLVLIAPLRQRTKDGYDYRLLLLKRNAKSTTFFSAHVFPGGNLDPIDKDQSAWSQFLKPTGCTKSTDDEAETRAVKLCALRETFEECGILLFEGNEKSKERWVSVSKEEKKIWRNNVYKDGRSFVDLFASISADDQVPTIPALSALQYRANWITPANMKRRFDTHFFISILPLPKSTSNDSDGESVHSEYIASADGGETVSADWLTPKEAIDRTLLHAKITADPDDSTGTVAEKEGNQAITPLILFPPQFYLVAELARTKSWQDLVDPASSLPEKGIDNLAPRSVHPFEPEIKGVEDESGQYRAATVLIGDPAHSKTDLTTCVKTDRHRTYVLLPGGGAKKRDPTWKAKPPLGLTVMGVHREGMGRLFGKGWEVTMKEGDTGADGAKGLGNISKL